MPAFTAPWSPQIICTSCPLSPAACNSQGVSLFAQLDPRMDNTGDTSGTAGLQSLIGERCHGFVGMAAGECALVRGPTGMTRVFSCTHGFSFLIRRIPGRHRGGRPHCCRLCRAAAPQTARGATQQGDAPAVRAVAFLPRPLARTPAHSHARSIPSLSPLSRLRLSAACARGAARGGAGLVPQGGGPWLAAGDAAVRRPRPARPRRLQALSRFCAGQRGGPAAVHHRLHQKVAPAAAAHAALHGRRGGCCRCCARCRAALAPRWVLPLLRCTCAEAGAAPSALHVR